MTNDAQSALRRIIEDYTKSTRFCIICNYVSKIIDPIASRCAKFRFSPLTKESQFNRLKYIAENENFQVDSNILNYLIDISEGDLRRSINLLQSISQLGTDFMTPEILSDVCGTIPNDIVDNILESSKFSSINDIIKAANNFFLSGFDLRQLLIQLNEYVIANQNLNIIEKGKICEIILDAEVSLLENSSSQLKLYNIMSEIRKIFAMN